MDTVKSLDTHEAGCLLWSWQKLFPHYYTVTVAAVIAVKKQIYIKLLLLLVFL